MAALMVDSICEVILHAGLRDAGREIDQRLLFGRRARHADGGFQAGQFAVRIEDIEFGLVGNEGGPGVFRAVGVTGVGLDGEFAGFTDVKALDHAVAVAVAVNPDYLDAVAPRVMMDTMSDGSHLLEETSGRIAARICSARLHGREIEKQYQQALILVLDSTRGLHIDGVGTGGHGRCGGRVANPRDGGGLRGFVGDVLKLEDGDLLWLAVLEQREVLFLQILDGRPVLGANEDIHHDQLRGGLEGGYLLWLPSQAERQEECCEEPFHAGPHGQNLYRNVARNEHGQGGGGQSVIQGVQPVPKLEKVAVLVTFVPSIRISI
jgi:hypothetical protein